MLWALPIVIAIQYWGLYFSKVGWCGFNDCYIDTASPNVGGTLTVLALSVLAVTAVLFIAPWTRNLRLRFIAPPIYAVAVAAATLVWLMIASV